MTELHRIIWKHGLVCGRFLPLISEKSNCNDSRTRIVSKGSGGVTASFATLGDINLAEPKCMIGFAGPRVVKETTHQNLPPGFQTAEFMLEHGLIDAIVPRAQLRDRLASLLSYMLPC